MPCLMCLWTLTWNFLIRWLCFLANSLNFLHSLSYLKPCFISLCVNSVCFALKALKLSQILPILTSWDMYTPYVGFAGILPSKNGNRTTLKEKLHLVLGNVTYVHFKRLKFYFTLNITLGKHLIFQGEHKNLKSTLHKPVMHTPCTYMECDSDSSL